MDNSARNNNKRIAKNTIILFARMMVLLFIGLFTSRVILNALGFENYGIYNLVGGFVAMFSLISGQLSAAISRFLAYSLGKNNELELKKVFSTSVNIQLIFSFLTIVLAETIGLWFFYNKLEIPIGREVAAMWVYQLSVLSFCVNLISVPYNSAIVAHEKMSAFAYISILEVALKLVIVFLVFITPYDVLIVYAILMFLVTLCLRFIYGIYTKKHFKECTYHLVFDRRCLIEMVKFSGWNFFGAASSMFMEQGINVLMNMFFGVLVNAASGIAVQLNTVLENFVNNFTIAINPQITKSYAANNLAYMHSLVIRGARYSFYLLFIISFPLLLESEQILVLWLKNVPPLAVLFLRLILINNIVRVFGKTTITAIFSTGDIKQYQLSIGMVGFTVLPVVYFLYKLGMPVYWGYVVDFIAYSLFLIIRLRLCYSLIGLSGRVFAKEVFVRAFIIMVLSFPIPLLEINMMNESLTRLLVVTVSCIISSSLSIFYVGLTINERIFVLSKIREYYYKIKQ